MAASWILALSLLLLTSLTTCTGEDDGLVYRVTSIVHEPYLMIRNVTDPHDDDLYEGFVVDLLDAIADFLDFEYEIHLIPDNRYGRRDEGGRWNGMVGELVRGQADIAAAPLTQTPDRRSVVDFAYPFQAVSLTALMRKDIDISSIEELANQTEVTYGTFKEGATQQAFIGASDPLYRRMWATMASYQESPFIQDFAEGLERAREEDFAFIVERPTGEWIVERPPCDLKLVGRFTTDSLPRSFAFALPKRHPLLNDVNAAMLHLLEDMRVAKMYRKWWPNLCEDSTTGGATAVAAARGMAVAAVSVVCVLMAAIVRL